jgi:DDB1- and CUL4-associated factor 11
VSFSARAHTNDVNAVAFADEKNSNLVFSGSDDAMIHVWDRRVFRSSARGSSDEGTARPDGSFVGHTEGITYISGKGDGIYLLSNAKDQTLKLWDIRKLSEYRPNFTPKFRQPGWDYRMSFFPTMHPGARRQADDTSLLTCVGHQTLQTLIRCGFSPIQSTGQRYLYCGSYDGCVYIYDLNGEIVKRLKAGDSLVRDCSWHPYDQVLMATAWDGTIKMFTHDPDVVDEDEMEVSTPEPSEAEEEGSSDAQMQ